MNLYRALKKSTILVGMVVSQSCLNYLYSIHKRCRLLVPTAVLHRVTFYVALQYKKGLCCHARYIEQSLQVTIFFFFKIHKAWDCYFIGSKKAAGSIQ